uniref:Uncharacterized protein n=1 Tax=Cercocebus atys TaxID=9531 RepID=A0A2K5M7N0_CERAT
MVCEGMQGSREEGMVSGCCTRVGACLACSCGFVEPAVWGMLTLLAESHINILGDSYANKDELHKGLRPWTNQNNKQKPEGLAAEEKPWGLRAPEGSVLQEHIQPPFYSFLAHVGRGHCRCS